MTDRVIRELEREAAAGDPGARARLIRELERKGDREALCALGVHSKEHTVLRYTIEDMRGVPTDLTGWIVLWKLYRNDHRADGTLIRSWSVRYADRKQGEVEVSVCRDCVSQGDRCTLTGGHLGGGTRVFADHPLSDLPIHPLRDYEDYDDADAMSEQSYDEWLDYAD